MNFQNDYLLTYGKQLKCDKIEALRQEKTSLLHEANMQRYKNALDQIEYFKSQHIDLSIDSIKIGDPTEFTEQQQQRFKDVLDAFKPWKKGPFQLFGHHIDSEWQSQIKWNRILPHCEPLEGRKIADIGCNNGYFMFRMANYNPKLVIGFEPFAKNYYNFKLMQGFAQIPSLFFELLGVEDIDLYPKFFDTIFCLGILYHHTDPIALLRKMHGALDTGGEIIIDCQGIDGDEETALVPKSRYANAKSIWYLPTANCLHNWLTRTQFKKIEFFYNDFLTPMEQRRTEWAPIDSLSEFLDPNDCKKTIEGYPAPKRFYVKAVK